MVILILDIFNVVIYLTSGEAMFDKHLKTYLKII